MTAIVNYEPRFKDLGVKVMTTDELAQALHAQSLLDDTVPITASMIDQCLWVLLINNTKIPFWTSDNSRTNSPKPI